MEEVTGAGTTYIQAIHSSDSYKLFAQGKAANPNSRKQKLGMKHRIGDATN